MKPYEYLIKAGIGSMMASYSSINGTLMHGNGALINDELKKRMGFKGFVTSDFNAVNALDGNYGAALNKAINAGIDQIMLGPSTGIGGVRPTAKQLLNYIKAEVEKGHISTERIRDAARRVLWAKFESGLMDQQPNSLKMEKENVEAELAVIGSDEHRKIARQAV